MPGAGTDRTQDWPVFGGPAIILVEPQMGENIGATARAMANFGLTDLRLVRPRDGWPNPQAVRSASGADRVIEGVRVYHTTEEAVSGCTLLLATTAREHGQQKAVLSPEEAALRMLPPIAAGETVGILFGRERTGLENYEISLCDCIVTLPVNPAFSSLNLAQAVLIVAYEWHMTADATPAKVIPTLEEHGGPTELARQEDIELLFDHLERELDESGYLFPPDKRPTMVRNLRSIFLRANLTEPEVRSLRGVVKALVQRRRDLEARGIDPGKRRSREAKPE
jgi:tRNA/rRNA methyltransferase